MCIIQVLYPHDNPAEIAQINFSDKSPNSPQIERRLLADLQGIAVTALPPDWSCRYSNRAEEKSSRTEKRSCGCQDDQLVAKCI